MLPEKPKRLTPTKLVLRELYLKSGNQCACSGCGKLMINAEGVFIGEICHIEAALQDGQRFNAMQTNEERRGIHNLMLMCYEHHKVTDNVEEFTVDRLKTIKKEHEKKYFDVASILQQSITDLTTLSDYNYSKSCKKLGTILNWGLSDSDLEASTPELNVWVDKLRILPLSTRQVFCIMIMRSAKTAFGFMVKLHEIEKVTCIKQSELLEHYEMLERYGFVSSIDEDDYGNAVCYLMNFKSGWEFWNDVKSFSSKSSISVNELIENLHFNLLD